MGIGFKHGAGGSNPLNFKVIVNPQPETAKENTIWVDTDRINNYYFSATQPENMAKYDLWFRTDTSSPVTFNALKKNGIQVYPLLVKQYVGGAWVDKTAKSYQGGAWVDWITYLYNNGDECTDITGGWEVTKSFTGNSSLVTLAQTDSQMQIKGKSEWYGYVATKVPVDLTPYKTISITVDDVAITGAGDFSITVTSSKNTNTTSLSDVAAKLSGLKTKGVHTLNVSDLDGRYFVGMTIGFGWVSGGNNDNQYINVSEAILL